MRGPGAAIVAVAALSFACAASSPRGAPPPAPPTPDAGSDAAAIAPAAQDVPTLDGIAERGSAELPMMREIARAPEATAKPTELEAKLVDVCFRAIVAASGPARAWFEDDKRARRGELSASAGLVPPRGPACARKGETLRLVVETHDAPSIARAVIWQSP